MKKVIFPFLLAAMTFSQLLYAQTLSVTPIGGTSSDQYADSPGGEGPDKAFDGNQNSKWLTFHSTAWLQFISKKSVLLTKYAVTSANDFPDRDPKNWTLQASKDDSVWVTLDTRSNVTFAGRFQRTEFAIPTPGTTSYSYFRLNVTANNGGGLIQISEVELYASSASKTGVPVAVFGTDKPWLNTGQSTTFRDYSTNNPVSWKWSFPGGTPSTSTAQNPVVTYATAGTYAVTLKVSNADGSNKLTVANKILVKSVADNNWTTFDYPGIKVINFNDQGTSGQQVMHTAFPNLPDTLRKISLAVYKSMYNNVQEGYQYDSLLISLRYYDGIAEAGGDNDKRNISVSTKWLDELYYQKNGDYNAIRLELKGMFYHEITHTYQPGPQGAGVYGTTSEVAGFIEGEADYVRQISLAEGRVPQQGGTYYGGYSTTAFFFMYIGNTYFAGNQDNFSYALNATVPGLNPAWSFDKALKLLTGKSVYTLWKEYQASLDAVPTLKPLPDFVASKTVVALNEPVVFTNLTGNVVQSYAWTFTGGTPSTSSAANPTVTYSTAGTYTVTLQATNTHGSQTATKTSYITVANKTGQLQDLTDYLGELSTDNPTQVDNAGNVLYKAIDNDHFSHYNMLRNSAWIQWKAAEQYEPVAYSVTSGPDEVVSKVYDPTSLQLKASNDGNTWVIIHIISNLAFTDRLQKQTFAVTNQNGQKYTYFRLELSNPSNVSMKLAEWEIFGLIVPGGLNQKPLVSITSPASGTVFTAPASVAITASATDYDGTITKVNFYAGSTRLFVDNASPYAYTWTGVTAGTKSLKAVAYDNSGDSTVSAIVSITVNPAVTCTAPVWSTGTAYSGGAVVQYNGIKYTANFWTQGARPDMYSGPAGSGQPWLNNGTCNSKMGDANVHSLSAILLPNPVEDLAYIQLNLNAKTDLHISVLDVIGNVVIELFDGEVETGDKQVLLNASALSSGVYLVRIEGAERPQFIRFIRK